MYLSSRKKPSNSSAVLGCFAMRSPLCITLRYFYSWFSWLCSGDFSCAHFHALKMSLSQFDKKPLQFQVVALSFVSNVAVTAKCMPLTFCFFCQFSALCNKISESKFECNDLQEGLNLAMQYSHDAVEVQVAGTWSSGPYKVKGPSASTGSLALRSDGTATIDGQHNRTLLSLGGDTITGLF